MNPKYEAWTNSWGIGRGARAGGRVAPDISEQAGFRDDTLLERRQREIDAMDEETWLETLDPDIRNMFIAARRRVESRMPGDAGGNQVGEIDPLALETPLPDDDEIVQPDAPERAPDEDFGAALNRRAEARFRASRMAATDQATRIAVTEVRQNKLAETLGPDHPLVKGYGLRTIQTKRDSEKRAGMRIENPYSSAYHRDEPGAIHKATLDDMVTDKIGHPPVEGEVYYISDLSVITKMTELYGENWGNSGIGGHERRKHLIGDGIMAIQFVPPLVPAPPEGEEEDSARVIRRKKHTDMEHHLYSVGGFPSAYDIINAAHPSQLDPLRDVDPMPLDHSNSDKIAAVLHTPGVQTLETAIVSGHPHANIAAASVGMLEGLQKMLVKVDAGEEDFALLVRRNPVVAEAISEIGELCDLMQAQINDAPRLARLYDLLVDEVHLVLSVVKPYTAENIKGAATDGLTRKSPSLVSLLDDTEVEAESFLLASGMDAMSSAVVNALRCYPENRHLTLGDRKTKGDDRKLTADYFEVGDGLLKNKELFTQAGNIMVLTLNPSTPVTTFAENGPPSWDVSNVVGKIRDRFTDNPGTQDDPVIAILDITVEKPPGSGEDEELETLFRAIGKWLADGSLILTVNKSYQKYPSMGSGKILSGGATVIGCGPQSKAIRAGLRADEDAGGCLAKEESQLACHFMTQEEDLERTLLAKAAENATFVKTFFEGSEAQHQGDPDRRQKNYFGEGLPYLVIGGQGEAFDVEERVWGDAGKKSNKPAPMHMMWEMGVEQKMSFGFHTTSALPMPGGTRIALGQESKSDLVELLYAVGKLTYAPPVFNANRAAADEATRLRGDGCKEQFASWPDDLEHAVEHRDQDKTEDRARRDQATDKAVALVKAYALKNKNMHGPQFDWNAIEPTVRNAVAGHFANSFPNAKKRKKPAVYQKEMQKHTANAVETGIKALGPAMKQGVVVSDIEKIATDAASQAMPAAGAAVDSKLDTMGSDPERARFLADLLLKAGLLQPNDVKRAKEDQSVLSPKLAALTKAYEQLKANTDPKGKVERADVDDMTEAQLLRQQMALYGAATTPFLAAGDRKGDDPSIMHSKVERRWDDGKKPVPMDQNVETAFLPNIVASCALLSEAVFDDRRNARLCIAATDALMDIGMDGISNETCQALLTRRIGLLSEEPDAATLVAKLKQACESMPYPEGAATAFIDTLPGALLMDSADGAGFADRLADAALGQLPLDYLIEVRRAIAGGDDTHREPQPEKLAALDRLIKRRTSTD
ncbi:hypothetical protein [Sedimentitalea nanhaiensis]|uniref:Uncharacterized protein n=1 Tax=Sedimentitalea nanhaiensis TaxID=999627 RepID=A0A1I7DE26_9RHOB|nr:hypothetical protein [Sedimentitalea nanhaiensis]SFU09855.1 hypothetical protein SAMN05216236_12650 [Sedimentitalea nanhaiensis]